MSRKTNENVTINDAMVKAISEAVTSALVSALATATASNQVASAPETIEPETTTASPKKSNTSKADKRTYKGCAGYIEKNGKRVYIAYIDRNGNNWIAKLDKSGKPVFDKKTGKVATLYNSEEYDKAKKAASAKAKKAGKRVDINKFRAGIYQSLGYTTTGKVKSL